MLNNLLKHIIFPLSLLLFCTSCSHEICNEAILRSDHADSIFSEIWLSKQGSDYSLSFSGGSVAHIPLDSASIWEIYTENETGYYWGRIFITPGDSLSFKFKVAQDGSIDVNFIGKNAAHYNYFSLKNKEFSDIADSLLSNQDDDLITYKDSRIKYRRLETMFLNKYIDENKLSDDFKNYAFAQIENFYALELFKIAYSNRCCNLPKNYISDATINFNVLSYDAYEAAKFKYVYMSDQNNIEQTYKTINDSLTQPFRSAVLSELVLWFCSIGDASYKESLFKVMQDIESTSDDTITINTIKEYKPYYLLSGTKFPDNILDNTYLIPFDSKVTVSLRNLLESHKNKAVLFDFWSSGCRPCREANKLINKQYFDKKNIDVINISLDDDEEAWKNASLNDNSTRNQYMLNGSSDSELVKFLKVNSIPRFVLLNKKHELTILNLIKPIDCGFIELQDYIEKNQVNFVTENKNKLVNTKKECVSKTTKYVFYDTLYYDNFGKFLSSNEYIDANGYKNHPTKNWQTKFSKYQIPHHRLIYGSPDDGYYTIGTLKKGVMWDNTRGGITKDASGDINGAVLCINVTKNYIGELFHFKIDEIKHKNSLFFEISLANASYSNQSTPPKVEIILEDDKGNIIGSSISKIDYATQGWQKLKIDIPPIDTNSITFYVISKGEDWENGCDLLIDDIILCQQIKR